MAHDLHFPSQVPLDCIQGLIAAVRANDYVSTHTLDHLFYACGCANALRDVRNGVQFEAPPQDLSSLSDDELCARIEAQIPDDNSKVVGAASDWFAKLLPFLMEILRRVLDKYLPKPETT